MNVVYSASDRYSELAGVSLTSLLINNQDVEEIHVFILDNGICPENKLRIQSVIKQYNRDVSFFSLPENLLGKEINLQKWNISTFGRLFEASILPESIERVVHIDCDTVINGSLKPIWNIKMGQAVVAGACDSLSDEYKRNIGMEPGDSYINAGVIVLNLKRIRELGLENKFFDYISKHCHMLTYVDQEVLNACVQEKEKIVFPLKYNAYSVIHYLSYGQLKQLRHVNKMVPVKEYNYAKNKPVVIHYTSCFLEGTRPWMENDNHPMRGLFLKYKSSSPWRDGDEWPDERSSKDRLVSIIIKTIPMCILAPVIGYIHGVYVPRQNKKKQDVIQETRC